MKMQFQRLVYILLTSLTVDVSCECGIVLNHANSLNNNENIHDLDVFPWDVKIFERGLSGAYIQVCVGTLISPSVVISSAYCYDTEFDNKQKEVRPWTVVAGKRTEGYDRLATGIQESEVESVHLARGYRGSEGFWARNIAWLSLKHPFNLTSTISPVCIDFDNQYESEDLQSGQVGKIISRQSAPLSETPGREIRLVTLSVISNTECVSMVSEALSSYVTADKFCAISVPGSRLIPYFNGGGLHFQHNGRWFLRGVINGEFLIMHALNESFPMTLINVGRFVDEMKNNINIKKCGAVTLPVNPLIVSGYRADHGGLPWHVAVYQKNLTGFYDQICGGSLISSNVVVSAAHCFYDDNTKQQKDASNFAVAAGKHYRPYNWPEGFVQKSPVQAIHLSSRYHGVDGLYAADIAWLILERPFDLSAYVKPICLESSSQYVSEYLQSGQVGRVAGWGITANGSASHELQEMNAPFVQHEECISKFPRYSRPYVTTDKFCAGHLNGTTLCNGDSGGGLAFQRHGRWYLLGIVSVNPIVDVTCNTRTYTAFTDVKRFSDELYRYTNLTMYDLI